MKVLIISQPVLSETNNMGKTLMGYFSNFEPTEVAQLYLRSGTPNNTDRCSQYYRFSDEDALHSLFDRRICGRAFDAAEVSKKTEDGKLQTQSSADAYKVGSKHKAWMLLLRDFLWKISNWKNQNLLKWISDVNPDVIFFAAGDGGFSYRIADYISRYLNKPLVVVCMDDFYLNNRNRGEFLGNLRQTLFMKTVRKTMKSAIEILTICDSMNKAYSQLFDKKCLTLHTAAIKRKASNYCEAKQVSYIGNVGCGRYKSLVQIGKALSEIQVEGIPRWVDVYTASSQPECINPLKSATGIRFYGAISAEEVLNVMAKSTAVIHTESFEQNFMDMVRFSVSTKIAESLMYGPCLIAYGPEGIASIDYLKENGAAYVISRPEDLESGLTEILTNRELREQIVKNARELAIKNHNTEINPKKVRMWLSEVVNDSKEKLTERELEDI